MLYITAERWHTAVLYRDAFERVKGSVFDRILCGIQQPQTAITSFDTDTRVAIEQLSGEFPETSAIDFHGILDSMSGGSAMDQAWDIADWDLTVDNLGMSFDTEFANGNFELQDDTLVYEASKLAEDSTSMWKIDSDV